MLPNFLAIFPMETGKRTTRKKSVYRQLKPTEARLSISHAEQETSLIQALLDKNRS